MTFMPELPEVETTLRGIYPKANKQIIKQLIIRNGSLRWPVDTNLTKLLPGLVIQQISRRAKYLLLKTEKGHIIIHLGMSGVLRILPQDTKVQKHDHIDLILDNGFLLRYNDPRRFGCFLWTEQPIEEHRLLRHLAPEPLTDSFNTRYLFEKCNSRKVPIKTLLMDNKAVVGVGNIYANEALFATKISPIRAANEITMPEAKQLCANIKSILAKAIEQGGTTLKDFLSPDGKPGYFVQQLAVYDRDGMPCHKCKEPIVKITQAQRASFYCQSCQN